jgi:hypothetical protein
MGTDIHCFLERKTSKGWAVDPGHLRDRDMGDPLEIASLAGRNYHLFGIVAGVRSNAKPIKPPRGFPKDASEELTRVYQRNPWYHTATYLTPRELQAALNRYKREYSVLYAEQLIDLTDEIPEQDAFSRYGTSDAVLRYIRSYKESEKVDNILLSSKKNTRFRIVIWFDS